MPSQHDVSELLTFVVVDPQRREQDADYLPNEKKQIISCDEIADRVHEIPRYFTKEKAKEALNYVMYPRGSPLWVELKRNLKSGITVSLVSVPLSISLAIAGGASPVMGVVTAFWAGIIGALLGGSHYNIVGPTGALSGVLAASSLKYGVGVLPILAIVAGLMCFIVWILRLDKYVMFIPSSVIHGFTVGVAFIIALNQLNSALGLSGLKIHESFLANLWESLTHIPDSNAYSIVWFILNLTALILLGRKWPKMPWSIVIAVIGILAGWLTSAGHIPISLQTLQGRYGELDFKIAAIPKVDSNMLSLEVLTSSIGIAFIAILETLISARIADGMTKSEHDQRREVMSISIANVLCGAMGGIPATAALARTALNIKTGATSRVSAIINSICVLLLSFVFLPFFKFIPMSTIAALLVMTAIKMIAAEHLIHMWKYDRVMFWIAAVSAIVCVAMDTMAGILVGAVISLLIFTDKMSVGHTEMQLNKGKRPISRVDLKEFDEIEKKLNKHKRQNLKLRSKQLSTSTELPSLSTSGNTTSSIHIQMDSLPSSSEGVPQAEAFGDTLVYRITGQLTYINATAHMQRVKKLSKQRGLKNIVISLRYLWYADLDGVDSLEEMVTELEAKKIRVFFAGVIHDSVKNSLEKHPFYQAKVQTNAVFKSYLDALNAIEQENNSNLSTDLLGTELDAEEQHLSSF